MSMNGTNGTRMAPYIAMAGKATRKTSVAREKRSGEYK
jgi:hypothetical protein